MHKRGIREVAIHQFEFDWHNRGLGPNKSAGVGNRI